MTTNHDTSRSGTPGLHWIVALLLLAGLLLLWMSGYGPFGSKCSPAATPVAAVVPPVAAPVVTAPVAAPAVAAAASVASEPQAALQYVKAEAVPAAKILFTLGKTDMIADPNKTLAEIVTYLKGNADAKAQISGYHDPKGNKAANEELAHNRARAVREVLNTLGIPKERVIMAKPEETTGQGNDQEARRVEVTAMVPKK